MQDNKTFHFKFEGYQYLTKTFDSPGYGEKTTHYVITPDGRQIRIKWRQNIGIMSIDDLKLWIKVGKPLDLGENVVDSQVLRWIDLAHQNSEEFNESILKIKTDLHLIDSIQLILEKTFKDRDEEKSSILGSVLVKTTDYNSIKKISFKETPYPGFYFSNVKIEGYCAYIASIKNKVLSITLGDSEETKIIPSSCVDILLANGWELQSRRAVGSYLRAEKCFNLFSIE